VTTGPGGSGFSGGGAPGSNTSGSNLTFRFDLTVSDLAPNAGTTAVAAAAAVSGKPAAAAGGAAAAVVAGGEGSCYASLLKRGLGQNLGGPYLTPAGEGHTLTQMRFEEDGAMFCGAVGLSGEIE